MNKKPNISIQFEEEKKLFPAHLVQETFDKVSSTYNTYNAVNEEIAHRLTDRLEDLKRPFNTILDLGCGTGTVKQNIHKQNPKSQTINVDISHGMLKHAQGQKVQANAEDILPFRDETFDLVISNMALPFINDIPKFLHLAGKSLKKDGLFLASTLGLESFNELRQSFEFAKMEGAHIFPLPDVRSVGAALQRRGYALPVVDRDLMTISYPNLKSLYEELTNIGARNLNPNRFKGLTGKRKWKKMEEFYQNNFTLEDGTIAVTLEVIYLHGFRPHASQPQPLQPGSAQKSMAESLNKT